MKHLILILVSLFLLFPTIQPVSYTQKSKTIRCIYKTKSIERDTRGEIKRSPKSKKDFIKSLGYKKVPIGYEVDHIVPLWKGGCDMSCNMQLLTIKEHRKKTGMEARERYRQKYRK